MERGIYLDTGIVWGPCDECNLASRSLAGRQVVVEVVDGISWSLSNLALYDSSA